MHIVHDTRTQKRHETRQNRNIFNKYCILARAFIALNATKYLFCCVRFTVHVDTAKCVCIAWTACISWILCRPAPSSGSGCCWIAPGAGDMGGLIRRGLAPQVPAKIKSPPLLLEKSRKRKKGLQTEVLKDWECGKNLKKLLKNYLTTLL